MHAHYPNLGTEVAISLEEKTTTHKCFRTQIGHQFQREEFRQHTRVQVTAGIQIQIIEFWAVQI